MSKLSYSLPNYDSAMNQLLREIKSGFDKTHPILGQIQTISVVHGGTTRQVSEPNIVDTPMALFSALVTVNADWVSKTDISEFASFAWNLWHTFSSNAEKRVFEIVDQTSEAVGNIYEAKGQNLWDAQIEALKMTEMRFDKDGNHNVKFYFPPKGERNAREVLPTPEQNRRLEEIINAKREEYYAKKRTRRLS